MQKLQSMALGMPCFLDVEILLIKDIIVMVVAVLKFANGGSSLKIFLPTWAIDRRPNIR